MRLLKGAIYILGFVFVISGATMFIALWVKYLLLPYMDMITI